jgi:pimeloyl-ACP methyl ester carboxylesterase
MAIARVNGVDLYHEVTGEGTPLVWSHEFGGDHRSWEPQVRFFARRHRIVTYNHRGYPPSSVPKAAADYSQDLLVEDLYQLLRHLELGAVHLGGCSMGANRARLGDRPPGDDGGDGQPTQGARTMRRAPS